jgi:hypothetical protein
MEIDDSPCGQALTCSAFTCQYSTRNHHVRLTEACVTDKALCPIPSGQACDINKMRRIKNELGNLQTQTA